MDNLGRLSTGSGVLSTWSKMTVCPCLGFPEFVHVLSVIFPRKRRRYTQLVHRVIRRVGCLLPRLPIVFSFAMWCSGWRSTVVQVHGATVLRVLLLPVLFSPATGSPGLPPINRHNCRAPPSIERLRIYPQLALFIHRKGGVIHILCETGRLPERSGWAATETLRPGPDIIVSGPPVGTAVMGYGV